MTTKFLMISSALMALASSTLAQDNDFRLFEEVQSSSNAGETERRVTPQNSDSSNNGPEFVLVGTSRIGNHYSAILEHRSGNVVRFQVDPDRNTRIPGYRDFSVVSVAAGELSLRFPDDTPCLENSTKGVSCSSVSNIAMLTLAVGDPVVRAKPEGQDSNSAEGSDGADQEGNAQRTNPFAALQRAAANNNDGNPAQAGDRPQPRTFQVRRIAPEDVPEGMRVISTPFGDRLVEE